MSTQIEQEFIEFEFFFINKFHWTVKQIEETDLITLMFIRKKHIEHQQQLIFERLKKQNGRTNN